MNELDSDKFPIHSSFFDPVSTQNASLLTFWELRLAGFNRDVRSIGTMADGLTDQLEGQIRGEWVKLAIVGLQGIVSSKPAHLMLS